MTWDDSFKLISSMLVSVGGATFIIFALSSWLGKIWSERILNKYKAELDKEIETYKSELNKIRNDYHRFSNKKFEIINETWSALFDLTEEFKIYDQFNNNNYHEYLLNLINVNSKYLKIIRKNSLFFNDETEKLLLKYVSICSDNTIDASEKMKNASSFEIKDMQNIMKNVLLEFSKKQDEREKIFNEIKIKFQKELGNN